MDSPIIIIGESHAFCPAKSVIEGRRKFSSDGKHLLRPLKTRLKWRWTLWNSNKQRSSSKARTVVSSLAGQVVQSKSTELTHSLGYSKPIWDICQVLEELLLVIPKVMTTTSSQVVYYTYNPFFQSSLQTGGLEVGVGGRGRMCHLHTVFHPGQGYWALTIYSWILNPTGRATPMQQDFPVSPSCCSHLKMPSWRLGKAPEQQERWMKPLNREWQHSASRSVRDNSQINNKCWIGL